MYPFAEGQFAVRNAWYVAAFSHEVGEALLERWFLGDPVVLYRKQDGAAVAVAGRCPHRQFPMTHATREGDALVCGYHGITFGADGRCLRIPTQERCRPPSGSGLSRWPSAGSGCGSGWAIRRSPTNR